MRPDDLERHFPAEARVLGAIHLAHPAGAEGDDDLVGSEAGTAFETHRRSICAAGIGLAMALDRTCRILRTA
jgi:hypothetical protein